MHPLDRGGPLGSRNFRLLAACALISVTGSQVAAVAIPFAVLRSGGSASDVGYVATAELMAMIGCLLLGGVIADRLPRHHVIMAAEALQALGQGVAAALVLTGHARVWQLAVLAATGARASACTTRPRRGCSRRPCPPASARRPTRSIGPAATRPPSAARRWAA